MSRPFLPPLRGYSILAAFYPRLAPWAVFFAPLPGFDLENENETVRNYRDRIRQCEALGEFAMAEQIRQILMQEQDHQIDLATALGVEVPNVGARVKRG
jgi:hypothetical protein